MSSIEPEEESNITNHICEIDGDTAYCDASWVHSAAVKGFLKARWDGQDPCYERPYVATSEGLRW